MDIKPGTQEYTAIVRKKKRFIISVFVFSIFGAIASVAYLLHGIQQHELAKLILLIFLCFFALTLVTILSLNSLYISVDMETTLQKLKDQEEKEKNPD